MCRSVLALDVHLDVHGGDDVEREAIAQFHAASSLIDACKNAGTCSRLDDIHVPTKIFGP